MTQLISSTPEVIIRKPYPALVGLLPDARKTAETLFGIALLLTACSLLGMCAHLYTNYESLHRYIHHLVDRIDVNEELSIPTFYATSLLLGSSLLLWLAKRVEQNLVMRRKWSLLAIIFLLLALDEASSFHEFLNLTTFQAYVPKSSYLQWTWVIPGLLFSGTVFLVYVPFLRKLSQATAVLMVLAGTLYIGGAVGMEMVGASLMASESEGLASLSYCLATHVEELLEMSGLIVFIYCLLAHLNHQDKQVVILSLDSGSA